jgi:hypothetical protein
MIEVELTLTVAEASLEPTSRILGQIEAFAPRGRIYCCPLVASNMIRSEQVSGRSRDGRRRAPDLA